MNAARTTLNSSLAHALSAAALLCCAIPAAAATVTAIEVTSAPPFKPGQNILVVVKADTKCSVTLNDGAGKTWDTYLSDSTTPPSKTLGVNYAQPGSYVLSVKGKAPCTGQAQTTINVPTQAVGSLINVPKSNLPQPTTPAATTGTPPSTTPKSPCDSPTANCKPDFAILSVGEHPLAKNIWYVTVKNQGMADAPICKLEFEAMVQLADNSTKKVTRVVDLQPLKVGEKVKWGFDINKDLPPNSRVTSALYRVDTTGVVAESNEGNNTATAGAGAKFDPNS
jgi:CARDB